MLTYERTRDKQFFEYDKILSYIDIKIWKIEVRSSTYS